MHRRAAILPYMSPAGGRRLIMAAALLAVGAAISAPSTVIALRADGPTSQIANAGGEPSPTPPSPLPATADPSTARGVYPEYGPIPDDIVRDLRRREVEIQPASTTDVAVSLKEAVNVACGGPCEGVMTDQVTATLVTVTTYDYGRQLEHDPAKPSRIDPGIDHQLVWVITLSDIPEVLISGSPRDRHPPAPGEHLGTRVTFVSSDRSQFLYALSF